MSIKTFLCTVIIACILRFTQAATLEADYQLQGTLDSTVGSAPALNYLNGSPSYITDTVDGQSREVLDVSGNSSGGPQAIVNGVISSNNYSIVLLASFSLQINAATKLLDFKDLNSDSGLYVNNGLLAFFDDTGASFEVGGTPLITNGYGQIVLTRDGLTSQTTAYVNGEQAFSFTDTSGLAIFANTNGPDLFATFFLDDDAGLGTPEGTSGDIARIRLYDGALTGDEVASLDRLEPVPEPTSTALLILGGIVLTLGLNLPSRASLRVEKASASKSGQRL